MAHKAFTLIEVMAVVVLLGLLAGAVAWSMAEDLSRDAKHAALQAIVGEDEMVRLAARSSGRPCVLRLDIDNQRISRATMGQADQREQAHSIALRGDWRMSEVILLRPDTSAQAAVSPVRRQTMRSGAAEIRLSPVGLSPTYIVRLDRQSEATNRRASSPGHHARQWLVVAGMTGGSRVIHEQQEIDNLLATLTRNGTDAD